MTYADWKSRSGIVHASSIAIFPTPVSFHFRANAPLANVKSKPETRKARFIFLDCWTTKVTQNSYLYLDTQHSRNIELSACGILNIRTDYSVCRVQKETIWEIFDEKRPKDSHMKVKLLRLIILCRNTCVTPSLVFITFVRLSSNHFAHIFSVGLPGHGCEARIVG